MTSEEGFAASGSGEFAAEASGALETADALDGLAGSVAGVLVLELVLELVLVTADSSDGLAGSVAGVLVLELVVVTADASDGLAGSVAGVLVSVQESAA